MAGLDRLKMYISPIKNGVYSSQLCSFSNNGQNYVTMGIYCYGLKWNDDSMDKEIKEGPNGNIGPLGISGFLYGCFLKCWYNVGTPISHPKMIIFSRKRHGGNTHIQWITMGQ